jgi:hypothetical protein
MTYSLSCSIFIIKYKKKGLFICIILFMLYNNSAHTEFRPKSANLKTLGYIYPFSLSLFPLPPSDTAPLLRRAHRTPFDSSCLPASYSPARLPSPPPAWLCVHLQRRRQSSLRAAASPPARLHGSTTKDFKPTRLQPRSHHSTYTSHVTFTSSLEVHLQHTESQIITNRVHKVMEA